MLRAVFESIADDNYPAVKSFLNDGGTVAELQELSDAIGNLLALIYNPEKRNNYAACWAESGMKDLKSTRAIDFFCRRMFIAMIGFYHKGYGEDVEGRAAIDVDKFKVAARQAIEAGASLTKSEETHKRTLVW